MVAGKAATKKGFVNVAFMTHKYDEKSSFLCVCFLRPPQMM